jgi:release factor H-coupled RctB family protein
LRSPHAVSANEVFPESTIMGNSAGRDESRIAAPSPHGSGSAPIHSFYSPRSWIEGKAVQQLETLAKLPGVAAVAAMPDLHPGKYGPVGCAMLAAEVHPLFVGADIGCGMGLFQLDVPIRKLRADKTAERLRALDGAWDGDPAMVLAEAGLASTAFDASLGTIGGGNHFCEVQAIDEIADPEAAAKAGLDPALAYVLVHSGSRGLGYAVLEKHLAAGGQPLDPASEAGAAYLDEHGHAARWAAINRRTIASRTAEALRADCRAVTDLGHNLAERHPEGILHRKGAAPADRGLVPVPGSRGDLSYLAEPLAPARPETLASLAHGAGRKYDRSSMHGRVGTVKSDLQRLNRNPFGGLVVCENRDLLVEEAPEAYKSAGRVIADLVEFGLARTVATFRPLVTFKTAHGVQPRERGCQGKREERR